jgi:hypothetical protein
MPRAKKKRVVPEGTRPLPVTQSWLAQERSGQLNRYAYCARYDQIEAWEKGYKITDRTLARHLASICVKSVAMNPKSYMPKEVRQPDGSILYADVDRFMGAVSFDRDIGIRAEMPFAFDPLFIQGIIIDETTGESKPYMRMVGAKQIECPHCHGNGITYALPKFDAELYNREFKAIPKPIASICGACRSFAYDGKELPEDKAEFGTTGMKYVNKSDSQVGYQNSPLTSQFTTQKNRKGTVKRIRASKAKDSLYKPDARLNAKQLDDRRLENWMCEITQPVSERVVPSNSRIDTRSNWHNPCMDFRTGEDTLDFLITDGKTKLQYLHLVQLH